MTKPRWLLLLLASGCIDTGPDPLDTTAEEIRGGAEMTQPGFVGMWIGGGFCSASLIADDALVTAAHCQSGPLDPQMVAVVEREASGRYRCLTSRTGVLGAAGEDMEAVRFKPGCEQWPARFRRGADTGAPDDFMVMRLDRDRWWGKNRDELIRVLQSPTLEVTNGLHADTADDTYRAFGASSVTFGSVRSRSAVWAIEDDEPSFMNLEATDAQGVCFGDSGGPVGFKNLLDPFGVDHHYTTAGVLSRAELSGPGCAMEDGDNQDWTRIAPFIPLITELLGRECKRLEFAGPEGAVAVLDCDNSISCVGTTGDGTTAWTAVSANTIAVDVDTSACGLATVPSYFPTLLGTTNHWRAMGAASVFVPTATGFRVIVTDRGGPVTPAEANLRHWRIAWHAAAPAAVGPGGCTGIAPASWHDNLGVGGGIYADINTGTCGYTVPPTYIASLTGTGGHNRTTGISSAYDATATGFRVYLHAQDGLALTAAIANANNWRVRWLAKPPATAGEYCAGSTPTTGWTQVTGPGGSRGVTRTVDISSCGLTVTPRILASLGGTTMHWNTTGVTSLYNVTQTSFQVFVYDESGPVTPADATARGWHVDYAVRR
jgi:hypothetical protein